MVRSVSAAWLHRALTAYPRTVVVGRTFRELIGVLSPRVRHDQVLSASARHGLPSRSLDAAYVLEDVTSMPSWYNLREALMSVGADIIVIKIEA